MFTYTFNNNKKKSLKALSKIGLLAAFFLTQTNARAQVVNNGGAMKIEPGGQLKCTGSLNNTAGAIDNDGRIEVHGNFINTGTYVSAGNRDSLVMQGDGNVLLSPGGAVFQLLTINKTNNADIVSLGSSLRIKTKFNYLSGVLSTDYLNHPSYLLEAPVTAEFNFAAGREVVGTVKRTGWTNGSPVLFNSAHTQVITNGGTSPADVMVTMLPQAFGGDPSQMEREVKRKFIFKQNGGSDFTADVRFPYATAELNNNAEPNIVPWFLATEWNAKLSTVSRDAVNKSVTVTSIPADDFAQEWKLADPRYTFHVNAYLKGGWNNPTGVMRTVLNSGGLLPLAQPYSAAPYNYNGSETVTSIPNANIVDWVLLELRKPSTGLAADALSSAWLRRFYI